MKAIFLIAALCGLAGCTTLRSLDEGRSKATRAGIFEFHNVFWINLHHYLYDQAGAEKPDVAWAQGERASLEDALKYYRDTFGKRDLVMDDELRDIKDALARAGDSGNLEGVKVPAELRVRLEKVSVVYRNGLWAKHATTNDAWIASASELLVKYGPPVQRGLEKALQKRFDDAFYRVDVTYVAGWSGAYTTLPAHTVIASSADGNQGFAALEMLYHEITHTGPFRAIDEELTMALARVDKKDPGQLGHALHFYTVGEATRRALKDAGNDYVPYAEKRGLFGAGRSWERLLPVFTEYWVPYLDGRESLRASARAVAEHLPASTEQK